MTGTGFAGTGIPDHGSAAEAAERPPGEQEVHSTLFNVAGCFLFHALRLLPGGSVDDGGHPVRYPDGSPNIDAGVSLVGEDPHQALRGEVLPMGCAEAPVVQLPADPGSGEAGAVQIEYIPDDGGLLRLDGVPAIRAAGVSQDPGTVIKTAVRVIRHPAGDVFRQLAGVPLRGSLQHTLQEHAGGSFRDRLHRVEHANAIAAQLPFVDGTVLPVPAEAVHLPGDDGIIRSFFRCGDHALKSRTGGNILETAAGMIRVFVDDGIPFPGGKSPDVRQLLLDRYVTLAGGGVTGIRHGGPGRAGGRMIF